MFFINIEYKHKFETETRKKIVVPSYGNVNLRISNYQGNINILTITNVTWALKLAHNLLNTIYLTKKDFEMFLTKYIQLFMIIVNGEIFGPANMIKN